MKKNVYVSICLICVLLSQMFLAYADVTPNVGKSTYAIELVTEPIFDGYRSKDIMRDGLVMMYKFNRPEFVDPTTGASFNYNAYYYDESGTEVLNTEKLGADVYDFGAFGNGLSLVYGKNPFFMNKNGNMVFDRLTQIDGSVQPITDHYFGRFINGYCVTYNFENYSVGFVDQTGKYAFKSSEEMAVGSMVSKEGIFAYYVEDENGDLKVGYMDLKGNVIIAPKYDLGSGFVDGVAKVLEDDVWGLINTKGEYLFSPKFSDIKESRYPNEGVLIDQGKIVVKNEDDQFAVADKSGNLMTPYLYDYLANFDNYIAVFERDGKLGYLNTEGKEIIQNKFDDANHFVGDVALVGNRGLYQLIDKQGEVITAKAWTFDTTITFNSTIFIYQKGEKFGLARMVSNAQAKTVPSNWAIESIKRAMSIQLVPDHLQNNYQNAITREEFCDLAVRFYETTTGEKLIKLTTFSDTRNINVYKLAGIGIISGVGNRLFEPNSKLTREQAAVILVKLFEKIKGITESKQATFTDASSIASWATESVGKAQAKGIMNGVGNNLFGPKASYTIEQSILTMIKLYDLTK